LPSLSMKIFLDTVGCRLNQSELESMARQFRSAGHDPAGSDRRIWKRHSCSDGACVWMRRAVRRISRAGVGDIVVTGCWATLQPQQAAALPNVQRIVTNSAKEDLVFGLLAPQEHAFDNEPLARQPLPGLRQRTRAFIKVQDGCDNRCTFCITTIARGAGRSRSIGDVIADVQFALAGGTKEVVLTGVHLGSWGQDFGTRLRDLIQAILRETDVPRLRLSSLEPWDIDPEFWPRRMSGCRHLHLLLQSDQTTSNECAR
jgi:threonylcarbamoyladenosine tRNA methylthiotransferase MtaB